MIIHVITWYESKDGRLFEDETECMMHELNLLYQESGIRFLYKNGKVIKNLNDVQDAYGIAEFITVDRTKENRKFIEEAIRCCGWILLLDIEKSETTVKYRMLMDRLEPVK